MKNKFFTYALLLIIPGIAHASAPSSEATASSSSTPAAGAPTSKIISFSATSYDNWERKDVTTAYVLLTAPHIISTTQKYATPTQISAQALAEMQDESKILKLSMAIDSKGLQLSKEKPYFIQAITQLVNDQLKNSDEELPHRHLEHLLMNKDEYIAGLVKKELIAQLKVTYESFLEHNCPASFEELKKINAEELEKALETYLPQDKKK